MRWTLAIALLHIARAVRPGGYCGSLSLPFGLSLRDVRLEVHPNRHSMSMEFHSPKASMNCRGGTQQFTTTGLAMVLSRRAGERCVTEWMDTHGIKIRYVEYDPWARTIALAISKKVWPITYKKTLHLASCGTAPPS